MLSVAALLVGVGLRRLPCAAALTIMDACNNADVRPVLLVRLEELHPEMAV